MEAVATLAYVKKIAADQLLRSAGVPEDLIKHFLKGKDQATGDALTKRQHAAFILGELEKPGTDRAVIQKIVDIVSSWTAFHLANNEFKARAVVEKARDLVGVLSERIRQEDGRPQPNGRRR